jgi:hypothetical protein
MKFFLGVGYASWLARAGVPLFVTLHKMEKGTLYPAIAPWALDSGAYSRLVRKGKWDVEATEYAERVARLHATVGMMEFAFPQDWICSPPILAATGLTVKDHQTRTVESVLALRDLAPDVPWAPVLQGWESEDYERHAAMYEDAGVDLRREPVVGLGSIAARQDDPLVGHIVRTLASGGFRLHGLGVKMRGLRMYGDALFSADSFSWAFDARFNKKPIAPLLPECVEERRRGEHPQSCGDCLRWALAWRERILGVIDENADLANRPKLFDEPTSAADTTIDARVGMRRLASAYGGGHESSRELIDRLWDSP